MAQSKKPRKPYRRPDFKADAARLNPEKYGEDKPGPVPEKGSADAAHFNEVWSNAKLPEDTVRFTDPPKARAPRKPRAPRPQSVPIDKEPPAPAHPHVVHPPSPRAAGGGGRYLVPIAAGAGVIGGGAFLAHRARQRKATMAKGLIDPTTGESVVYERAYIDDAVDKAGHPLGNIGHSGFGRREAILAGALGGGVGGGVGGYAGLKRQQRKRNGRVRKSSNGALVAKAGIPRRAAALMRAGQGAQKIKSAVTMERAGIASGGLLAGALLPRKQVDKRYDESAVEHHGSRRVGGRLPVSSVRVSGLPVQSATFSRGNAEARPGTRSHALKLTHVRTNVKASRGGKLVHIGHRRSAAPGPMHKSLFPKSSGFAQSGGSGRRLINV